MKFKSVYFFQIVSNQETKASDYEERAEEEDLDGHELLPSPDSGKSTDNEAALSPIKIRSDVNGLDHEECDELIHVENTTQACIMHALSIVSSFYVSFHSNSNINLLEFTYFLSQILKYCTWNSIQLNLYRIFI